MFYLMIITISSLLITFFNLISLPTVEANDIFRILMSVLIGVVSVIAEDALSALIIRRLSPSAWYSPDRQLFRVSRKERNFYRSLGIKKWKDLVPELGLFTGFSKNELKKTSDKKYLERFLLESNYGVAIHIANGVLGFVIMFIPHCSSPAIWVPIFCVNFVLSMLPVMILRYTSYTLAKLYERSQKL